MPARKGLSGSWRHFGPRSPETAPHETSQVIVPQSLTAMQDMTRKGLSGGKNILSGWIPAFSAAIVGIKRGMGDENRLLLLQAGELHPFHKTVVTRSRNRAT